MENVYRYPGINTHAARAEKASLKAEAEKLINAAMESGHDLKGAELKKYDSIVAQIGQINDELEEHHATAHAADASQPSRITPAGQPQLGLREVYNRASSTDRTQINALASILRGDIQATADLRPSGDGGYIIPSIVQTTLERNYAAFAPVVSVARLFTTDHGEPATFPVLSDSESAVQLDASASTGADDTVSGDTPPTALTGPQLKAYKVSSKPVLVSRELSTDSPINVVQEVIGALLARVIRFENLKYTKGNGTTEAEGFITNATAMHAGSGAVLDLDFTLDLAYAVPPLYRPNGSYMASDTTIKYLRKLKTGISGDKRALWKDAFEEGNATLGTPAKLHGYPIYVNNDMDSVASDGTFASAAPLAFGDFSKFVVRQAENGSPYLYVYPVPARDGRGVILFRRSDSKLLVDAAIAKLVV
ncbi:MAG TPA: phage major capsid protein [Acidobacteriaceae bacterium]|jgi:HK97 family phage major capsid protein